MESDFFREKLNIYKSNADFDLGNPGLIMDRSYEIFGGESGTETGFYEQFVVPMSLSFHQCYILIFIFKLLL